MVYRIYIYRVLNFRLWNRASRKTKPYQWRRACIDKLVLSSRRYYHEIPALNVLILAIDSSFPLSGCEGQSLIYGMHL